MRISTTPLLLLAVLALGLPACSGDDGLVETETGSFQHDPLQFTFPSLPLGSVETRRVELINQGAGLLTITDIRLVDDSSAGEFSIQYERDGEISALPSRIELPPRDAERAALIITYSPTDEEADQDSGRVEMATNDRDAADVSIPVTTGGEGAEIIVFPRSLDFAEVAAGDRATLPLKITNIGVAELRISRFAVNGSMDFTAEAGGDSLGDLGAEPMLIGIGEEVEIDVIYAPERLGPDEGELLITSNDIRQPTIAVNLRANGAAPCIQVVPVTVNFGSALMVPDFDADTPNTQPVSIESCGTTPLRVDRIEIEGPDGVFRVIPMPDDMPPAVGDPLFILPAATPDQEYPSRLQTVGFWPTELQAYGGEMLIYSNATLEPFSVDLFGRGVDNACPLPLTTESVYDVIPLDVLALDGSPSTDPGGMVTRWQWTVVSRPDGSQSQPLESFADPRRPADGGEPDDEMTPTTVFFVDLAGRYEIELQVYDNFGQVSCAPPAATVVIEAIPEKDLHIQLIWSTPDDPDETDNIGTDVDLHLRHQRADGAWASDAGEWDCYFGNKEPDWGIANDFTDNPSLDIDDTNGAGPENINLESPEVGSTYDVAALYFRAESTFGSPDVDPRTVHPSYVTVRVFVRGELLLEMIDRELNALRQLWWVASIVWCEDFMRCPEVEIKDQVLEEAEYARP